MMQGVLGQWKPRLEPGDTNIFRQNIFYGNLSRCNVQYAETEYNLNSALAAYKTACGDTLAQFIDPVFSGADELVEAYYLPTSSVVIKLKDTNNQAVGAVDYV
jgi:hypothetical protein